jgi:transcriptional regulator with XRE-family HTH domain
MTPKEQALSMLATGVAAEQVADIVGVTPSAISQWKKEAADCMAPALTLAAPISEADNAFDTKLDSAEDMALERISKGLPFANMGQALAAFRILNAARRRKEVGLPSMAQQSLTLNVNLTLPAGGAPNFVLNKQSEIVEVDGRTLVTTDSKQLDNLLASRAQVKLAAVNPSEVRVLEQAAQRLDGIVTSQVRQAPRRSPLGVPADML